MVDKLTSNVDLDSSQERVAASADAGTRFVNTMETIRDSLDASDNSGTTLGAMVGASVETTEAETRFNIEKGMPANVAKKVDDASKKIGG